MLGDTAAAGVEAAGLEEPAVAGGGREMGTAERLASRGFTLRQLLEFCHEKRGAGLLRDHNTTEEVVRDIVIPETAEDRCCYMESAFMKARGGPQRAEKLVSHAWLSPFRVTVLNIVLDATGFDPSDLWRDFQSFAQFDALACRLAAQAPEALGRCYWLCIFGVNEHLAICGDCWGCNRKQEWLADPSQHLAANPCRLCLQPKFNPCMCGTEKVAEGDPLHEIDKFDEVMALMKGSLVSLDPTLATLTRIWVVAEVAEAIQQQLPVKFHMVAGLAEEPRGRLLSGTELLPPVAECAASSPEDKRRILDKVARGPGGREAYDAFVNCLVEMQFGRCRRLAEVQGEAEQALRSIMILEMDFRWCAKDLRSLGDVIGSGQELSALRLKHFKLQCSNCAELADIRAALVALDQLKDSLRSLDLNFSGCAKLGGGDLRERPDEQGTAHGAEAGVFPLGAVFQSMHALGSLELDLAGTQVGDEAAMGVAAGLPKGLWQLRLNYSEACVTERGALATAEGLRRVEALQILYVNFAGSIPKTTDISDRAAVALAASLPETLVQLGIVLDYSELSDDGATALAEAAPRGLTALELRCYWTQVTADCKARLKEALGQKLGHGNFMVI